MNSASLSSGDFKSGDGWAWWQARRLRYNLSLASCGWLAYFWAVGQSFAFGQPMWRSASGGLGMTLFLGLGFLILMGIANICFLLGPFIEGSSRPTDVDAYRRTAWRLGLWGSLAVPFLFPLANLAILIAGHGA